jgi:hypothetical protein
MNKTNLFFGTLSRSSFAMLATWLHVGTLQKMYKKLNIQLVSNIELFMIDTESELGVLDITIELVKDVGRLWRHNFEKINFSLCKDCPNSK